MDYFMLFQQDQFLEEVMEETRRYAIQSGMESKLAFLTKSNLLCTMAVILLSGYHKLPYRNMYWEESVDTFSKVVSDNIRRDTFTLILKTVHFVNNEDLDNNDRFAKVRKIFDNLNKCSKKYLPIVKNKSIDEMMIFWPSL